MRREPNEEAARQRTTMIAMMMRQKYLHHINLASPRSPPRLHRRPRLSRIIMTLLLSSLNSLSAPAFVTALSGIYESSPWIPESIASARPFSSIAHLQSSLANVVANAGATKQLALINAHPALAFKAASSSASQVLTANSTFEQQSAGMTSLTPSEQLQFDRYTKQYNLRHSIPFIVCVLALDRNAIIRSLGERVFASPESEVARALVEIDKIAAMRLGRLVRDDISAAVAKASLPIGSTRPSTGVTLVDVQYGKSRVRVLKIVRSTTSAEHTVLEADVQVLLRGDLDASFTRGDNACIVATDTVKNTVLVLSRVNYTGAIEDFACAIGAHFLHTYPHLTSADVRIVEKLWERMSVATESAPGVFDGPRAKHAHSFQHRGPERPHTHVITTRAGVWIESGVSEYMVLKSTASGFSGYPRCQFTTLPPTDDRILSTKISATWTYSEVPKGGFRRNNEEILRVMIDRFATRYSVSVQATVYEMTLDAFVICPSISAMQVRLPNVHFLLFNLAPFGLTNANEVFQPTDEPHGTIELTVARDGIIASTQSKHATSAVLNALTFPTSEPCRKMQQKPKL